MTRQVRWIKARKSRKNLIIKSTAMRYLLEATLKIVVVATLVGGVAWTGAWATGKALDREARAICEHYNEQAEEIPYSHKTGVGFYVTAEQEQMCNEVGIPLTAYVTKDIP
jgi:hypothetical protein